MLNKLDLLPTTAYILCPVRLDAFTRCGKRVEAASTEFVSEALRYHINTAHGGLPPERQKEGTNGNKGKRQRQGR